MAVVKTTKKIKERNLKSIFLIGEYIVAVYVPSLKSQKRTYGNWKIFNT